MESFEQRLENLRDKKGYSKKEMSHKLGFTDNVYGSYERGERRPSFEALIKLADIFDVSLDFLIRGTEYKEDSNLTQNEKTVKDITNDLANKGIKSAYFLQSKKWAILSKEDVKELNDHFEWIVEKARMRKYDSGE
ncbi:helix-turn-helix domain-containing protein [Bacillus sp. SD088]|uniref:helix-turn-helix domain-containing protein n=1 Tax=Bacillus sp. SD088 TaxID=2782012 RepID=UPI001A968877|nr:helix-turn-helix domain-containing protein [Bacillus sp. SD088]MBO0993117.1 helix-turn-helix transcriptional regulator [Bacillus sp. SD088]